MAVYFIKPVGQDGPIKIGHSRHPEGRLATYLQWSPVELELVATIKGAGEPLERRIHYYLREDRLHHEWFRPSDRVMFLLWDAETGIFNPDRLPPLSECKQLKGAAFHDDHRKFAVAMRMRANGLNVLENGSPEAVRAYHQLSKPDWTPSAARVLFDWVEARKPSPRSVSTRLFHKICRPAEVHAARASADGEAA